jgi:hypothetical protein
MPSKEAIIRQIRAAFENEPRINFHHYPIKVDIADAAVVLEGEVESIAAKKLALELAGAVDGICGAVDRLRIALAERRGDGAVRDALCDFLLRAPELRTCAIQVRAKGRVETLRDVAEDRSGEIEVAVDDGVVNRIELRA